MNRNEVYILKKFYINTNKITYPLTKNLQKEKELLINLYIKNDLFSAKKLVTKNINNVINIAKKYTGYKLNLSDLIQEGIIGLMKAIKKFNPKKGTKLLSFAIHWIKSEIHEYIIKNLRLIKIATTKSQRKLFFNIKKINSLTIKQKEQMAKILKVKIKDIIDINKKLSYLELDFNLYNEKITKEEEEEKFLDTKNKLKLKNAIENLNLRGQDIIKKRWLCKKKHTLKELAFNHSISIERTRQIEETSLKILREKIKTYD